MMRPHQKGPYQLLHQDSTEEINWSYHSTTEMKRAEASSPRLALKTASLPLARGTRERCTRCCPTAAARTTPPPTTSGMARSRNDERLSTSCFLQRTNVSPYKRKATYYGIRTWHFMQSNYEVKMSLHLLRSEAEVVHTFWNGSQTFH